MIVGLSHLTIGVSDLDRTRRLYVDLFGAFQIVDDLCGRRWDGVDLVFRIGDVWMAAVKSDRDRPMAAGLIAFKVHPSEFDWYEGKIRALGLEVEGVSRCGTTDRCSIRFFDYDKNRFELQSGSMPSFLKFDATINPSAVRSSPQRD